MAVKMFTSIVTITSACLILYTHAQGDLLLLSFRSQCLQRHNYYRLLHGAPPLILDFLANDLAQQLAQSAADSDGPFRVLKSQARDQTYGINEYKSSGFVDGRNPVDFWYRGSRWYDYNSPTPYNLDQVGGFSQIVWKESKRLGVGKATSVLGNTFVVCLYGPEGNVFRQFRENVGRPVNTR